MVRSRCSGADLHAGLCRGCAPSGPPALVAGFLPAPCRGPSEPPASSAAPRGPVGRYHARTESIIRSVWLQGTPVARASNGWSAADRSSLRAPIAWRVFGPGFRRCDKVRCLTFVRNCGRAAVMIETGRSFRQLRAGRHFTSSKRRPMRTAEPGWRSPVRFGAATCRFSAFGSFNWSMFSRATVAKRPLGNCSR